jgi:hypothetical protein
MKTRENRAVIGLILGGLTLALPACSSGYKAPLVPTPQNPAATGVVKARRTPNENTEVNLKVQHMAPPDKVADDAKIYVVWAKPWTANAVPQNVGSLVIDKDRTGSLETKTPHERFDLMITPEPNGLVSQPTHEPVLKGKVTR